MWVKQFQAKRVAPNRITTSLHWSCAVTWTALFGQIEVNSKNNKSDATLLEWRWRVSCTLCRVRLEQFISRYFGTCSIANLCSCCWRWSSTSQFDIKWRKSLSSTEKEMHRSLHNSREFLTNRTRKPLQWLSLIVKVLSCWGVEFELIFNDEVLWKMMPLCRIAKLVMRRDQRVSLLGWKEPHCFFSPYWSS